MESYPEIMPAEPKEEELRASSWAFLTNHAHVLLCTARDPQVRARDIAEQVGITERAAQRILADLIADGYVIRSKVGRRNHYRIDPRGHLRHPVLRDLSIGVLLDVLNPDGPANDLRSASARPPAHQASGGVITPGRRLPSKSSRPTHVGRSAMRAMRVPGWSSEARYWPATSSPRYRRAERA